MDSRTTDSKYFGNVYGHFNSNTTKCIAIETPLPSSMISFSWKCVFVFVCFLHRKFKLHGVYPSLIHWMCVCECVFVFIMTWNQVVRQIIQKLRRQTALNRIACFIEFNRTNCQFNETELLLLFHKCICIPYLSLCKYKTFTLDVSVAPCTEYCVCV